MPADIPLLPLVELLLALSLTFGLVRAERTSETSIDPTARRRESTLERFAAIAILVVVSGPLLCALPDYLRSTALLPSDASSHAVVAKALATGNVSGGWVDRYCGGFPLFLHYQGLAVALVSGLIRLGLHPVVATQLVGLVSIIATPFVAHLVLRRAGALPAPALLGSALLALMVCEHPLDGGTWAYLSEGLLSQVVFMPVAGAWIAMVLRDEPRCGYLVTASLLPLAHTQLVVALFAVALPAASIFARGELRRRIALSVACALATGIAVYGPGLERFKVPFAAPEGNPWQAFGFPPSHVLGWWLDGTLLDAGRTPILTSAARLSLLLTVGLALSSRRVRGAITLLALATVFSVSGTTIARCGAPGRAILAIFSPQRVTALIPLALSAVMALGLSEVCARAERIPRVRAGRLAQGLSWGFALSVLAVASVSTMGRQRARRDIERTWVGDQECGPATAPGYSVRAVDDWVGSLERGRLVVDAASFPDECPIHRGIELQSPVPLGASIGGPGSQVGVMESAFRRLDLGRDGAAARAETLGVRYVLRRTDGSSSTPAGFRVRNERGSIQLLERSSSPDLFGVGFLVQRWSGPDAALRDALFADLNAEQETLRDPAALIEMDAVGDTLQKRSLAGREGDTPRPKARIAERPAGPGVYDATVEAVEPTFVVIRATFVSALWRVSVDGQPAATIRVAPGFLATRLPAGRHVVRAVVSWPAFYREGCLAAFGFVVLLMWRERRGR